MSLTKEYPDMGNDRYICNCVLPSAICKAFY